VRIATNLQYLNGITSNLCSDDNEPELPADKHKMWMKFEKVLSLDSGYSVPQ
jgi:hypothetical protein